MNPTAFRIPAGIAGIALVVVVLLAAHTPQDQTDVILLKTDEKGMPVEMFIKWVADALDLRVTFTSQARQQMCGPQRVVIFNREIKIPRGDLLAFAMSVLRPYKLALAEMKVGSVTYYLVEHLDQPTVIQSRRRYITESELEAIKDRWVPVVCWVPVKNQNVQALQTQIQRLNPTATAYGAAIVPVPSANGFIIVDFAPVAHDLVRLIQAMDQKPAGPAVPPSLWSLETQLQRLAATIQGLIVEIRKQRQPGK